MAGYSEIKRNLIVRTVENPEIVKRIAIGTAAVNFIAARQIEMSVDPRILTGADEPFIALTVFSVVVAAVMEAIKRAER
jgi:hypothetical protein